jgi:hypothetical protein
MQAYVNAGYSEKSARVNAYRLLQNEDVKLEIARIRTLAESKATAEIAAEVTGPVLSIQQCLEGLSRLATAAESDMDLSAATKALDTLLKAHGAYVTRTQDITDLRAQLQSLRPKMSPGAFRELISALAGPATSEQPAETPAH